ncbi:hypothetical protein EDC01DRAFT_220981 [Geopyxis carbonaria]|nr:hypothetical protein EDC01DRAFT_220981 [Geopyxis carbonaria]
MLSFWLQLLLGTRSQVRDLLKDTPSVERMRGGMGGWRSATPGEQACCGSACGRFRRAALGPARLYVTDVSSGHVHLISTHQRTTQIAAHSTNDVLFVYGGVFVLFCCCGYAAAMHRDVVCKSRNKFYVSCAGRSTWIFFLFFPRHTSVLLGLHF